MPDTIEVPISLIKAGDLGAIRELLPKKNLFGRWATHPGLGRGIIISAYPDRIDLVEFAHKKENNVDTDLDLVVVEDLTLDPVELTTLEDFENAPKGTIISYPRVSAFQKVINGQWESLNTTLTNEQMANCSPWKILRWGWGE